MIFEQSKRSVEVQKIHKLIKDLLQSARAKNKKRILELYDYAKKLDFDVINEKTTDRYNKAVDKANDLLHGE